MNIDTNSVTWRKISKHVAGRLHELREQNDDNTLEAADTAEIRGQIAFAKEILSLGESEEKIVTTSADYG